MAARGILSNPAMFAGYDHTPAECVADWVGTQKYSVITISGVTNMNTQIQSYLNNFQA